MTDSPIKLNLMVSSPQQDNQQEQEQEPIIDRILYYLEQHDQLPQIMVLQINLIIKMLLDDVDTNQTDYQLIKQYLEQLIDQFGNYIHFNQYIEFVDDCSKLRRGLDDISRLIYRVQNDKSISQQVESCRSLFGLEMDELDRQKESIEQMLERNKGYRDSNMTINIDDLVIDQPKKQQSLGQDELQQLQTRKQYSLGVNNDIPARKRSKMRTLSRVPEEQGAKDSHQRTPSYQLFLQVQQQNIQNDNEQDEEQNESVSFNRNKSRQHSRQHSRQNSYMVGRQGRGDNKRTMIGHSMNGSGDEHETVDDNEIEKLRLEALAKRMTKKIQKTDGQELLKFFNLRNLNALHGLLNIDCQAILQLAYGVISIYMDIIPDIPALKYNRLMILGKDKMQRYIKAIINNYKKYDIKKICMDNMFPENNIIFIDIFIRNYLYYKTVCQEDCPVRKLYYQNQVENWCTFLKHFYVLVFYEDQQVDFEEQVNAYMENVNNDVQQRVLQKSNKPIGQYQQPKKKKEEEVEQIKKEDSKNNNKNSIKNNDNNKNSIKNNDNNKNSIKNNDNKIRNKNRKDTIDKKKSRVNDIKIDLKMDDVMECEVSKEGGKISSLEGTNNELKKQIGELKKQNGELKKQNEGLVKVVDQQKSQMGIQKGQVEEQEWQMKQKDKEIDGLLEQMQQQKDRFERNRQSMMNRNNDMNKQVIDELNKQIDGWEQKYNRKEQECRSKEDDMEEILQECNRMEQCNKDQQQQMEMQNGQIEKQNEEIKKQSEQIEKQNGQIDGQKGQIRQLDDQI